MVDGGEIGGEIGTDGEDVPEETLWAIATDCMRRDMTSSLRACLAAESWKRLWPDENRGGNTKSKGQKYTFEAFAKNSFKMSETYAKQALAILNHSPELLEDAKSGLAEVAGTMGTGSRWPAGTMGDRGRRQREIR